MQSAEASCSGGADLGEDRADTAKPITGEACGENAMKNTTFSKKDLVTYFFHLH